MNFERNDLDWALGELLHLIWKARFEGMRVERRYPSEFFACMQVINAQPFEVRSKVIEVVRAAHPEMLFVHRENVRTP